MDIAIGAYHGLTYSRETGFGVLPSNPVMSYLRHTNFGLLLTKDAFQSNELKPSGQIVDIRQGLNQIGGSFDVELSYGEYDDFIAAALRSRWNDKQVVAGTTIQSFSFESIFGNIDEYQLFKGCVLNRLTFIMESNAMVTANLEFVGKSSTFLDSQLTKYADVTKPWQPFDSYSGELKFNDRKIATITDLELSIDNGITPAFVIGDENAVNVIPARIDIQGVLSAYFTDGDLLDKFINEQYTKMEVRIGPASGPVYQITLPRVKYLAGDNPIADDGPVQIDLPFQAVYDAPARTNIIIERLENPTTFAQTANMVASTMDKTRQKNRAVTWEDLVDHGYVTWLEPQVEDEDD